MIKSLYVLPIYNYKQFEISFISRSFPIRKGGVRGIRI